MNYTLHLPPNYIKPPLPGRDEWVADLRANADKQGTGQLHDSKRDSYCCLGRLSLLQGRLAWRRDGNGVGHLLHTDNPSAPYIDKSGLFPPYVIVSVENQLGRELCSLASCNDSGLTFTQIADIIEAVWDNAPRNW